MIGWEGGWRDGDWWTDKGWEVREWQADEVWVNWWEDEGRGGQTMNKEQGI